MTSSKRIELTNFEKMVSYPQQFGDYLVMGTLFVESSLAVDAHLVRKALFIMQQRHPFYRAHMELVNPTENRMFLNLLNYEDDPNLADKIKLEWLDLTSNKESSTLRKRLVDESSHFNSQVFKYGKENLLWKIQVIAYKDTLEEKVFKYVFNLVNHIAITDGLNTNTLTVELVNILNALMIGQECDEMKEKLQPYDNLHVLCKQRGLFSEQKHQAKIEEMDKRQMPKFRLDDKFKSSNESGFKLDFVKLGKETTGKILSKSKLHNIRLTGYFQTIALYALKSLYDGEKLIFPSKVIIEIAASLRVRYNLDFAHGGFHTVMVIFEADETRFGKFVDFWSDAKYLHELIEENTSSETGTLFSLSHSKKLDEFNRVFCESSSIEEVKSILNHENECDLGVSNLGRFVNDHVKVFNPDESPIEIREMYCTDPLNSNPCISPAIVLHVLYWRGEIFIEFGANKSAIGSSFVDKYNQLFFGAIHSTLN